MSKCEYRITWGPTYDEKSRICGDEASLKCVTCNTWFCGNHNLLSDCICCEEKVRCISCPKVCKNCSDRSTECAICHDVRPCNWNCEDCGRSNCGKCLEEFVGGECYGCGKLACCTRIKKKETLGYYCDTCYITHTE